MAVIFCASCHHAPEHRDTLVFLIESSPTNLDPRIGIDAQSEHIQALLFDGLVVRDASYRVAPGIANWDQPDPLTIVFHLRSICISVTVARSPRATSSGPSTPCATER
jgi:peptide/nickel transport system substrate-binding protein